MPIQRVEWTCPGCRRKYAIPATAATPVLCPACQQVGQDEAGWRGQSGAMAPETNRNPGLPFGQTRPPERGVSSAESPPPSPPALLPRGERGEKQYSDQGIRPQQRPAPQVFTEDTILPPVPPPALETPGFPLFAESISPPDFSRREVQSSFRTRRYSALRMMAFCFKVLGGLFALGSVGSLLYAISMAVTMKVGADRSAAIVLGLSSFIGSGLAVLWHLAFAQLIQVALDIEENTRSR